MKQEIKELKLQLKELQKNYKYYLKKYEKGKQEYLIDLGYTLESIEQIENRIYQLEN